MGATSADKAGIEAIRKDEGLCLFAYTDTGGKWTIGYGHLIKPGEEYLLGVTLTVAQAQQLFDNDLREHEGYVNRYITRSMSQSEFNAIVSLMYNIGPGNFTRTGMPRLIQAKAGRDKLGPIWMQHVKDSQGKTWPGLVARRKRELDTYYSGASMAEWGLYVAIGVGLLAAALLFVDHAWKRKN